MPFSSATTVQGEHNESLKGEIATVNTPPSQPEDEKPPMPPAAPNGGLLAWSQVLAAFFLFFNPW